MGSRMVSSSSSCRRPWCSPVLGKDLMLLRTKHQDSLGLKNKVFRILDSGGMLRQDFTKDGQGQCTTIDSNPQEKPDMVTMGMSHQGSRGYTWWT